MIGVYIIGGFVILLLLAIYGAIIRCLKELKGIAFAILLFKEDPWEKMVKRFEQSLDEKEED
jgi:hypothetical protein